ncbi:MAG: YCF48-related protein [Acidobacteriota bacterium]
MLKPNLLVAALVAATVFASACSPPKAPGSWAAIDTGTGNSFYSANFVSETVGWLNGQSGRSYEPPEGNENANKDAKPKKPGEKIEDPLKANQGFEVLQTTDAGASWKPIPDQFKNKIRSVWFVDPQLGWALTIDRNILHSTDGGATWSLQRKAGTAKLKQLLNKREPVIDLPEAVEGLRFIDAEHGWAWGGGLKNEYAEQPGILLVTIDGGVNWSEVPYPFDQNLSQVFFLDSRRAWASSFGGSFYKTTDGGLNWTKLQTKLPEDVFKSVFFTDENNGWVVGRSGRLAKTTDGGRTWRKIYEIKDEFKMNDIFFTDRNRGWAVGEEGAILFTPDAGESWIDVGAPVPGQFLDVVFIGERTGFVVGLAGAILKYEPR